MFSLKKEDICRIAGISLLLMLAGHAFCWFNMTFSGSGVLIDVTRDSSALTAQGSWLAPYFWKLRGSLSVPFLTGLFCWGCIAAVCLLLADLFCLHAPAAQAVLCGIFCLSSGMLELNASNVSCADVYALAFLLGTASFWCCARLRYGVLPAMLCSFLCAGFDPSLYPLPLAFVLLNGIVGRTSENDKTSVKLRDSLLCLAASILSAAAGLFMMYRRGMLDSVHLVRHSGSLFKVLTTVLSAWPVLQLILEALAVLLVILLSVRRLRESVPGGKFPSAAAKSALSAGLFLVLLNLPWFSAGRASQTGLVFSLIPFLLLCLWERPGMQPVSQNRLLSRALAVFCAVSFTGSFIFSNQVYLKKRLEFDGTLSLMTRVIDRAEQTEGYNPGITPVAIIGTPDASPLSMTRQGFEHLDVLEAAAGNASVTDPDDMTWYFWEILGYPFNFCGEFERDALAKSSEVREMPLFPAADSCRMIGDTLVIRLSE